ncbi:molybdopterin-dependent oxidoreductase [Elioraea tepida]|uniref:Molybdopterin-dependent oxidoreductase n=1 Tax=Elioraea tepida TaxID=2843330 RepID=A0A975YJI3_9PROT|nr:molybdopterin-dependent oxidoreductase [Elioraea tepida]
MARHRGRGFAAVNYPIAMNLGGDPSQALVHANPDGKFTVTLSSIDLGQGMKSVTRQIAAETLGVPVEDIYVDTADSDTGPHCMGSFASRGTHCVGNAVIQAALEARAVMLEAAAEELEVDPADLVTDGCGNIHVRGAPSRSITTMAACQAAQFRQGADGLGQGDLPDPAFGGGPREGRDDAGVMFRTCGDDRRGGGRRQDGRGRRDRHEVGLRGGEGAEPEACRAAASRWRVDGHEPCRLGNDGTLLSGSVAPAG